MLPGMAKEEHPRAELDWASSSVEDGELTVPLAGGPPSEWTDRLGKVVERLYRSGSGFGAVKVMRKRLRVASVKPGAEADVRHFLDSAVLQVNADFAPRDDDEADEGRTEADSRMTAVFRSFADDEGEGAEADAPAARG
jgi:hypothetical protein